MTACFTAGKAIFLWLTAAMILLTAVPVNSDDSFVSDDLLPYGFSMTPLQDDEGVNPRAPISLKAEGWGARLAKVELIDGSGELLFEAKNRTRLSLPVMLDFGTRYTLKVTAERSWLGQSESREVHFATAVVPRLEGSAVSMLAPDASVTLHFDRPVTAVQAKGDLTLTATTEADGRSVRLQASAYAQDRRYLVQLHYKTAAGVTVPPLRLELMTAPPLTVETNVRGLANLGLALPLQLAFSEALANRDDAANQLQVRTSDGKPVAGQWRWIGPRRLRFTPHPDWPASSSIEISANAQSLKSVQGGMLEQALIEQFSTGTDRKLFVYLDRQRVEAVENDKLVRAFKVSTGKSKTPTVTGSFYIYDRYRYKTMRSDVGRGAPGFYEVEKVPYTQFFHKGYAFHGAFWHNGFGRPASHGCVNMATRDKNKRWPHVAEDAGWLYRWAALGVPVTVMRKAPKPVKPSPGASEEAGKNENREAFVEANGEALSGSAVVSR